MQIIELINTIDDFGGGRRSVPEQDNFTLRSTDALKLKDQLAVPDSWGALIVRHLLRCIGFDEKRLLNIRLEHKLIQANLLNHYCPSVVPDSYGLSQAVCGVDLAHAYRIMSEYRAKNYLLKSALGEASGEFNSVDMYDAISDSPTTLANYLSPTGLDEEAYFFQKRVNLISEYRVHSLEDAVIPSLTFDRYSPQKTLSSETKRVNAFVSEVISALPAGLVRDSMYGWDIARDNAGRYFVLEVNPAGMHFHFRPGFHCSGFFQVPRWQTSCLAKLTRFIQFQYGIALEIARPDKIKDGTLGELYALISLYMTVLDSVDMNSPNTSFRADNQKSNSNIDATYQLTSAQSVLVQILYDLEISSSLTKEIVDVKAKASHSQRGLSHGPDRDNPRARPQALIHQLIESHAERTPGEIALCWHKTAMFDGMMDYETLNGKANQLARVLLNLGIRPENRIVIWAPFSADLLLALLATLKVGAAYIPVDPACPAERLQFVLNDSRPVLCVIDEVKLPQNREAIGHNAFSAKMIDLNWLIDQSANESLLNVDLGIHNANLSDVIYTSGSTGRPKGVAIQHSSLIRLLLAMKDILSISSSDRFVALTNLSFDISCLEIFLPLICGARIFLAGHDDRKSTARLRQIIETSDATVLQGTPTIWKLLLQEGLRLKAGTKVLSGGEALNSHLAAQFINQECKLFNCYGPTETTVWSTIGEVLHEDRSGNIGLPVNETLVYILDQFLRPVSAGEIGELYIAGSGLARGYLNNPTLTAERFVANPFSDSPGERMYRTGDLVKSDDHKGMIFCGRIDAQLKIHGVRIEPEEVEGYIEAYEGVMEAAVLHDTTHDLGGELAALLVPKGDSAFDQSALRRYLRKVLPSYMQPGKIIVVKSLPKTSSGKLERRHLSQYLIPSKKQELFPHDHLASTSIEDTLGMEFSQILSLADPPSDEIFIDLGGDSLQAIKLVNRIRQRFNIEISLNVLFSEEGSINGIARLIRMKSEV